MQRNLPGVFLAFALVLTSAGSTAEPSKSTQPGFPVRIGVLADSQITTAHGPQDYGMRRTLADRLTGVAIRPAAVEYLAPSMLDRLLAKLESQKVDLILYLGDGANSGCQDELDVAFGVLEESRRRSGIPSYYVIGNHDYLGAGNQIKMAIRQKLCNDQGDANPANTKQQVMDRISRHNRESNKIDKHFQYDEAALASPSPAGACPNDDNTQFTRFQAGILSSKSPETKVDIILMDSSDYRDVTFHATVQGSADNCEIIGGWGLKGSLSYKGNSQISELKRRANPTAAYRLLATHYRPTNFHMFVDFNSSPSRVRYALGDLLSSGQNIWLSGHTHTPTPKVEVFNVGKASLKNQGVFDGLNVGSTTDYAPHAVIVGPRQLEENRIGASSLGFTKVSFLDSEEDCARVWRLAANRSSQFGEICGTHDYETALGLNKSYLKSCWDREATTRARNNIDSFAAMASAELGIVQTDVKACLAYKATRNEGPRSH